MSDVKCKHCKKVLKQHTENHRCLIDTPNGRVLGDTHFEPADPPQTETAEQPQTDEECKNPNCGHPKSLHDGCNGGCTAPSYFESMYYGDELGTQPNVCICSCFQESAPSVPEGTLPFPASTCVECGEQIPSGTRRWCAKGGLCNHHVPAALATTLESAQQQLVALTAELAAERENAESYKSFNDQLQQERNEINQLNDSWQNRAKRAEASSPSREPPSSPPRTRSNLIEGKDSGRAAS